MEINALLIKEYRDEMNTMRKFLESISEDLFSFKPHESSQNLGELINHILPISSWIPAITQKSELDWSKTIPPTVLNSKVKILKQFEANVIIGEKALEATNNEELQENWTMRSADTVLFSGKKYTAIRRYVFNHSIHHRAQLGLYLRINGNKVPASYVRSADEMLF